MVSIEYSDDESIPEMTMPNNQITIMDKFPEDPPHPSPKRNFLTRRFIGAAAVAIVIIVTVVVVIIVSLKRADHHP
jgi:hypothetical protein